MWKWGRKEKDQLQKQKISNEEVNKIINTRRAIYGSWQNRVIIIKQFLYNMN